MDALISTIEHRGSYKKDDNKFEWSIKYTNENIKDRVVEWEVIDSAGFSINPPNLDNFNTEPYSPNEGPLVAYENIRATSNTTVNRLQAFTQWSNKGYLGSNEVFFNLGVRAHKWEVNTPNSRSTNQTVISPRAQLSLRPENSKDMLYRISGGIYYQPPFYRELRDFNGSVNNRVKAQKSIHIVAGHEYNFNIWQRPFKLVSEAYYKNLSSDSFLISNQSHLK